MKMHFQTENTKIKKMRISTKYFKSYTKQQRLAQHNKVVFIFSQGECERVMAVRAGKNTLYC